MRKMCVFGGQYGSEGKGAVAEYFIGLSKAEGRPIVVFGENGPNSGHTCSLGKTRALPASSFYADVVVLCPDSTVDLIILATDLETIRVHNPKVQVYIHENAALVHPEDTMDEKDHKLFERIGSTVTGGGAARLNKYFMRDTKYSVKSAGGELMGLNVPLLNNHQYFSLLEQLDAGEKYDYFFECSQGVLLDTNFGIYPFTTSRTTLPGAAIERNGLGAIEWEHVGVYRSFPIRTGGNTGPCQGEELTWESLGIAPEQASVTKRIRRIFEFTSAELEDSLFLTRPEVVVFTHMDYVGVDASGDTEASTVGFKTWIDEMEIADLLEGRRVFYSSKHGQLIPYVWDVNDEPDGHLADDSSRVT